MLKPSKSITAVSYLSQPPSGGCVLKPDLVVHLNYLLAPAAFGRLCVETALQPYLQRKGGQPPSGGCVLKRAKTSHRAYYWDQPPSGGCVLKPISLVVFGITAYQPPSGGCVLKQRK